jgi:hypothetical protein
MATMVSISRERSFTISTEKNEALWAKILEVNRYRVGTGDGFDANEQAFLHIAEGCNEYPFYVVVTKTLATRFEKFVRATFKAFPFDVDSFVDLTCVLVEK